MRLRVKKLGPEDLAVGILVEARGRWKGRHHFAAQKISCNWDQLGREIRDRAYLEEEPAELDDIGRRMPTRLRVGGEVLVLDEATKLKLQGDKTQLVASAGESEPGVGLAGRRVRYRGVRRRDGVIAARQVQFEAPRPADAYRVKGGIRVVRAKDPQTGIDILEFRRKNKVQGRLKLFPVKEVQNYVSGLGEELLPAAFLNQPSSGGPEFRFYVVEDAQVNASALPDGTVLINTGLLGVVENETQLAFILSHEIAHVTQIHYWRQVHETRTKRILLTIAGAAASYYIGDLGAFLGQMGLAAVWNGYMRRLENQADRLCLQNLLDHGYNPYEAVGFFKIMIDRYGGRTSSAIWSDHASTVLRGSFLTVQIQRQYPQADFVKSTVDTQEFRRMREAMGPVKSM